jgi:hypothetical protein
VTAGSPFTLTAKVKDAYGNQVTGYTGTVHFTSTDAQAVLPANYTFVGADSGTHSFSVTLKTAGWQTVTVADAGNGSVAGTSGPIMVSPTSTTKLVLDAPSNVTTGTPFAVRVRAEDQYGNTTPAYTGTVSWTSGDGQAVLPATYTFTGTDQGSHIFSVTLKTGGTQSITVTDTGNGGISGTASVVVNSTVTVSYSAAAGWNLVGGSPLTVWSGPEFQAAWSWNALSGQWTSLTSASPPQPQGSGAWEEVSGSSTETVTAQVCSAPVSVVVMPHRWNMVGNPCNTVVQLPAGTHAVSWNGTGYDLTSSIGIGAAAWVVPASGALTLSP